MLRFTPQQTQFLLNSRRQHETEHAYMQHRFGSAFIGNASPLPKDVWGEWDNEAIQLSRSILAVFNDLAGSVSRPMDIGKLMHYFKQAGDSGEAHVSLDGRSSARTDQPEYGYVGTPLPIVDSTFKFGWRQMRAAQTEGESLDAPARVNALRRVAEKLESIALVGDASIVVAGSPLYGLTNHPKRNTRSTGSTLNGTTGANWKAEIIATLKLLHGDNFRNRQATIYLNWDDWFYASQTDYTANYAGGSILKKIMEIAGVGSIVPSNSVTANTIIALVKERDVVEVLNGMPIMTRAQARHNPEDDYIFKTMAAAAVELKYDANDNIGLAVSS